MGLTPASGFGSPRSSESPTSTSDPSYTLLMDSPLPSPTGARYAISIGEGYVNETIGGSGPGQGNTIDIRGSTANLLSLDGFQFGTRVLANTFLGNNLYSQSGPQANASGPYSPFVNPDNPGETSLPWGWTHTPALGIEIDGNTFVDPSAQCAIRRWAWTIPSIPMRTSAAATTQVSSRTTSSSSRTRQAAPT